MGMLFFREEERRELREVLHLLTNHTIVVYVL
jgi:hypothetical protein